MITVSKGLALRLSDEWDWKRLCGLVRIPLSVVRPLRVDCQCPAVSHCIVCQGATRTEGCRTQPSVPQ